MNADEAFRKLRKAWFDVQLRRHAHEREWETAEAEASRLRDNAELWEQYVVDTEAILAGEKRKIAPRAVCDLGLNPHFGFDRYD